jgi:hypothetical protein
VVGCYEHDNEASGSIKGREFLEYLSDYQLLSELSGMIIPVVMMMQIAL